LLHCGDLKLDPASRIVWRDNQRVELTRKEFGILHYMMSRPGEVVSQEMLLEHVWNNEVDSFTNVVPVHIGSLRHKLGDCARTPRYIATAIGQGYRLVPPDDIESNG
ncbi:MAG: winged helix-turn-helix domain-containing protein, partial [Chloroflexota bacterium]